MGNQKARERKLCALVGNSFALEDAFQLIQFYWGDCQWLAAVLNEAVDENINRHPLTWIISNEDGNRTQHVGTNAC
ncbi:protein of unknown function [Cyanobium sp. NIES-981]|nr:protein of unknown function [Cyanobium sp. NIES-981]